MRRTLLALALIASAGASNAQTLSTDDPYNRPMVGRNDWVRQPGDQPGPSSGIGGGPAMRSSDTASYMTSENIATAPPSTYPKYTRSKRLLSSDHATGPEPMPANMGPRAVAFRDEYGFRYDSEGNRLNARGFVISPHTR